VSGSIVQLSVSRGGVPKLAVPDAAVGRLGLAGDVQKHLQFHGGPERAVCLYAIEVIERLRAEGHPITPGSTGENVTLRGIDWATLQLGDRLALGRDVIVQITTTAIPCKQIAASFVRRKFQRIAELGDARLYARVLRDGHLRVGDPVRVVTDQPVSADLAGAVAGR
jgi:MOSC domain-containing protein YiiM